jgi:hypothetical protein
LLLVKGKMVNPLWLMSFKHVNKKGIRFKLEVIHSLTRGKKQGNEIYKKELLVMVYVGITKV